MIYLDHESIITALKREGLSDDQDWFEKKANYYQGLALQWDDGLKKHVTAWIEAQDKDESQEAEKISLPQLVEIIFPDMKVNFLEAVDIVDNIKKQIYEMLK